MSNVLEQALEALENKQYEPWESVRQPAIAALKEAIKQQGEPEGREARLTAPEKIYLLVSDDSVNDDDPFPSDYEGIHWCEDAALDCNVPYVRADLAHASTQTIPDVDWLANVIRSVDGNHTLGAGALAEKIVEALSAAHKGK